MNINEILITYFNTENIRINAQEFAFDMFLTAILGSVLSVIYIKFGKSLSNRKALASNFVLLSLTTMLIISIVKSSLALSLGLVGALSIVRFRAAIKEPEELAYLFLSIALGLGFGAEQRYITLLAFFIIAIILIVKGIFTTKAPLKSNLYINFKSNKALDPNQLYELLSKYAGCSSFKRLDEKEDSSEYLFTANFSSIKQLSEFKENIRRNYDKMELTFFEEKDIFN